MDSFYKSRRKIQDMQLSQIESIIIANDRLNVRMLKSGVSDEACVFYRLVFFVGIL